MNPTPSIIQAPDAIPLGIGAAVLACAAVAFFLARTRDVRPGTRIWAVVFAFFAAFFGIWCARGLVEADAATFAACEAVLAAAGILVLQRESLARRIAAAGSLHLPPIRRANGNRGPAIGCIALRDAALLLAAALFGLLAVEMADNPDWLQLPTDLFAAAYLLVLVAMAALYFLGQRKGALPCIVSASCIGFGAAQYFVDLLRDSAFQPSDLLAWRTAAAVSGGYDFTVDGLLLTAAICGALSLLALALIIPPREAAAGAAGRPARRTRLRRMAANLALFCVLGGGLCGFFLLADFHDVFGIRLYYWDLRVSYHAETFTLGFATAAQDLRVQEPDGYSADDAKRAEAELAARYDARHAEDRAAAETQFSQKKPNIIAIMDESYADLSIYDQLHSGYDGTFVTRGVPGSALASTLHVSVFGGGTCNTEYEFLTGDSMAFLGQGLYPYQQFDFGDVPALPRQLASAGYRTAAIHPSYPDNWRRNVVYPQMGFQECYFFDDFDHPESFHRTVSDAATFDKALGILRATDDPAFVFDVTIQNHGGYATGSIPSEERVDVQPDFTGPEETAELDEYLSCIAGSDRDLAALLAALRGFDEPTVVVFFGDHQPSLARGLNDAAFPGEDAADHAARLMQTPCLIWANYDLAGQATGSAHDTSPNFLAAQALELAGAPLTDYQKALLAAREEMPAVHPGGYEDALGIWHDPDDDQGDSADGALTDALQPAARTAQTAGAGSAGSLAARAAADARTAYRQLEAIGYLEVTSKF